MTVIPNARRAVVAPLVGFFVSTTGNNSNPGTLALPWLTVQKAAQTLVAGETCYVRGGTYVESEINFTNSGTSGSKITLKAYPGETPIVDGGFTTSGAHTTIFRFDGPDHITLDGLTIQRGRTTSINISENAVTTGLTIKNCTVRNTVTGDNAANIYIGTGGANVLIQNCYIHGRTLGGVSENVGSGVIIFRAVDLTIEYCTVYDVINGLYYKHSNSTAATTVVQYNIIHDCTDGIVWSRRDTLFQHNVVYNTTAAGIRVFDASADCASLVSSGNQFIHNSVVDCAVGFYLARTDGCGGAVDTILRDNLVCYCADATDRCLAIWPFNSPDASNTTLTSNLFFKTSQASSIRVLASYYTVSTLPGTVTNSGNIDTEPAFVNYASDNFTLAGGSAGKNAASDGADMGAAVSQAGVH